MKKDYSRDMTEHGILSTVRERLKRGEFRDGSDVVAIRRFVRMTQEQFAAALHISVHTLRNWEQGSRMPEGPAIALLSIAAAHPRIIRQRLKQIEAA